MFDLDLCRLPIGLPVCGGSALGYPRMEYGDGITCSSDSRKTSFLKDSLLSPAPIFESGLAAVSRMS